MVKIVVKLSPLEAESLAAFLADSDFMDEKELKSLVGEGPAVSAFKRAKAKIEKEAFK